MQSSPSAFAYVADAVAATTLYTKLLGAAPVQSSPDFAMFAFPDGTHFGLWRLGDVKPATKATGGAVEFGIPAADDDELKRMHTDWQKLGLEIIQAPTQMPFGFTFTARDPDGHRLRVFVPPAS